MEAETRDQKNVPENNGDPELETDSIPAEVSKQDHKDEEVSGLRRRKPQPEDPAPQDTTKSFTHDELKRLIAPNGKYVAVSDGKGNYRLVPRPVHKSLLWFPQSKTLPRWSIPVNLNVWYWVMVVCAFVLRFWSIDWPRCVIFDEVHFGKFASYYLSRTFFFDVHPPLGKLIFAFIGYVNGFDGSFLFTTIGEDFPSDVPYILMRSSSAVCGALLIPTVYEIMTELGFTHRGALFACFFTLLDNSLHIQSRVIMLDSFVVLFTYLSILGYLKVYHCRDSPYSKRWHMWLLATGISLGIVLGVKYTGLFAVGCVGLIALVDVWQIVGDLAVDKWPDPNPPLKQDLIQLFTHMGYRGTYLLGIPFLMNVILFYIHFSILTNSGPGNAFVSLPFQDTLKGTPPNSSVISSLNISTNATLLRYSSLISLRNQDNNCWLHSHKDLYPLKYPDGRGSSYQQQITCYDFQDKNNFWAIRKPGDPSDATVPNDTSPVRNKDLVELVHVGTMKLLNSHDVAAPLTPANQEIAGYINYSTKFVPYLEWRLEFEGVANQVPIFLAPDGKANKLKLIHKESGQAMSCAGERLPEWGFQQYEVATDKGVELSSTMWSVSDVKGPNVTEEMELEEERLRNETLDTYGRGRRIKRDPNSTYSFIEKYFEMQGRMLAAHGNLGDHQFGATPIKWPLLGKTLPYWLHNKSNAQVTLIGNPFLWWASTVSVAIFFCVLLFYVLRRRRQVYDLPQESFNHWLTSGGFLVVGWMAHYLPYFLISRVLFLHHYLPALPFKFMVLAAMLEHGFLWAERCRCYPSLIRRGYQVFVALLCFTVLTFFIVYAPFAFGYPSLSKPTIMSLALVDTWDLLMRN